jgi:hypothetical protein
VLSKNSKKGEDEVRAWLKKNRADKAGGATDKQIDAKSSDDLWRIVFDLDDNDPADAKLVATLRNKVVTWDHHCGTLLVREPDKQPLTAKTKREDRQLWTFSADGTTTNPLAIIMREFAKKKGNLYKNFLHLAIWRLKPLAGGFAPDGARANAGGIGVDWPPRFIHWG